MRVARLLLTTAWCLTLMAASSGAQAGSFLTAGMVDAADAEDDLLGQAVFLVATIQVMR